MKKNTFILTLVVILCVVISLSVISTRITHDGPSGAQVGSSTVLHQVTTVASPSAQTIATSPVRLVDDPGDSCALELISVTGYRNFSSESYGFGSNKTLDEGFEIRLDESNAGVDLIASFSKGFADGGLVATTASPSFQTRRGLDVNASRSESFWLTASTSFSVLDGDTSFSFDTAYRKICTQ